LETELKALIVLQYPESSVKWQLSGSDRQLAVDATLTSAILNLIRNAFQGEQPNFETLGLHIQPSQHGLGIGTLQQHGGNISATARALNMHRRTLQRKLQKRPTNRLS